MSKYIDKFYTKNEDVENFVGKVNSLYNLNSFDYILEPSAGDGAFLNHLPKKTIALDLYPENDLIMEMDFFDYKFPKGKGIAIGNPPYGRRANVAKKFFNRCALYCDVIAFVLPRSMTRRSMHSNINKNFHLKYEKNLDYFVLPDGKNFYRKCVFQIWERDDFKVREDYKPETSHPDFILHHANTWTEEKEYNRIKELCPIGIGQNSMKIKPSKEFKKGSNWFVEPKNEKVLRVFKTLDFTWVNEEASCAPSVSKADIVSEYKKNKIK